VGLHGVHQPAQRSDCAIGAVLHSFATTASDAAIISQFERQIPDALGQSMDYHQVLHQLKNAEIR
jgi:hypothetical protein